MNNKLTKAILQAEASLPSLKRSVLVSEYANFRAGLERCRQARER